MSEARQTKNYVSDRIKYSAIVFAGGLSYGAVASIIKISYTYGFSQQEVFFSQILFGWLIFLSIVLGRLLFAGKKIHATAKQAIKLVLSGFVNAGTTIFYTYSLTRLDASLAITMLFQFTWMGILIQAITTKSKPSLPHIVSAFIIFAGTVLASGMYAGTRGNFDLIGITFGLIAALCCALFMYLSGSVALELHVVDRSFFFATGALIVALFVFPGFFASGALEAGVWKTGLLLGFLSLVIPVFLFSLATPHLPSGLSTIMASSELPMSILCAIMILGEYVAPLRLLGVAVILVGIVVAQLNTLNVAKRLEEMYGKQAGKSRRR
ncbi:MAG: DMT family transporter [Coriobacteriia bacterium]|nr:DMT family transporter [Coriobacteriia bacterium]